MSDLDRRDFLHRLAWTVPLLGGAQLLGDTSGTDPRRVLSKDPLNLEAPFASLDTLLTPTRLHYVRNHYPIPRLDLKSYNLLVTGAVKREVRLSLEQLQKLKHTTAPVTLECAGNGRSLLPVKVTGVQWGQGGVSTADWTGVPLQAVLDLAGVESGAVEVIFEGADKGDPKKEIQPPYPISFSRSLSLEKALRPETRLVWGMNGKELLPEHGYPLRLLVGGWYGMASVKWLTRIIVSKSTFAGFDQTIDYAIWAKGDDELPRLTPVTTMVVKSAIARPQAGAMLPIGKEVRIEGAAWAGEAEVSKVEVSTDEGKTWSEARLLGKSVPLCWRFWEFRWTPTRAGKMVLMARATDRTGRTQPKAHDLSRRSYMINFIQPVPVSVQG